MATFLFSFVPHSIINNLFSIDIGTKEKQEIFIWIYISNERVRSTTVEKMATVVVNGSRRNSCDVKSIYNLPPFHMQMAY